MLMLVEGCVCLCLQYSAMFLCGHHWLRTRGLQGPCSLTLS